MCRAPDQEWRTKRTPRSAGELWVFGALCPEGMASYIVTGIHAAARAGKFQKVRRRILALGGAGVEYASIFGVGQLSWRAILSALLSSLKG